MGRTPEFPGNGSAYSPGVSIGNVSTHPITGTVKVAIILAQFSDIPGKRTPSQIWQDYFGTNHSVAAYYLQVSYGKFTLSGDVFGWFTLPYPESHYGHDCLAINDADCSGSDQSWQIGQDAATAARNNVTFANYDYVVFVHSGYGQESSGGRDDIWSVTYLGGVWVNASWDVQVNCYQKTLLKFNVSPELEDRRTVPLGVYCHDFGHQLGLPDMYDTKTGKSRMGPWELLDKGLWNGKPEGSEPAEYSSWSRSRLGWLPQSNVATVPASSDQLLTIQALELDPVNGSISAVIVPINTGEYYLFENREPIGNDIYLPDHGIVGYHINDNINYFATIGSVAAASAFHPGDLIAKGLVSARVMAAVANSSLLVGFGPASNQTIEQPASLTIRVVPTLSLPITVNNQSYTTDPTTGSVTITAQYVNETFRVVVPQTVNIQPGVRAVFRAWGNGDSDDSESVSLSSNMTLTAAYQRQYLVCVTSQYGVPTGSGWYDENSQDSVAIASTVDGPPGIRYAFARWTGSLSNESNRIVFQVTRPMNLTAFWTTFNWMQLTFSDADSPNVSPSILDSLTLRAPNGTVLILANLQSDSSFWFQQGDYSVVTAYVYGVDAASSGDHFTTVPNGIATIALQLYTMNLHVTDWLFGFPLDGGTVVITLPNNQPEKATISNGIAVFEHLPAAVYPYNVSRNWSLQTAGQVSLPDQPEPNVAVIVIPSVLLITIVALGVVGETILLVKRHTLQIRRINRRKAFREPPYADYWKQKEEQIDS